MQSNPSLWHYHLIISLIVGDGSRAEQLYATALNHNVNRRSDKHSSEMEEAVAAHI